MGVLSATRARHSTKFQLGGLGGTRLVVVSRVKCAPVAEDRTGHFFAFVDSACRASSVVFAAGGRVVS